MTMWKTLLFFLLAFRAFADFSILAPDMRLDPPWRSVNTGDALDGDTPSSWVAPWAKQAGVSATHRFHEPVPAGTPMKFFVKCHDYDHGNGVSFTYGGVTSRVEILNDRDLASGEWALGTVVTNQIEASEFTVNFFRAKPNIQNLIYRVAYTTTNLSSTVMRDDRVLRFNYPDRESLDRSQPTKGNRVPNSSFECGVDGNWRIISVAGAEKEFILNDLWTIGVAYHGKHALRIPCPPSGRGQIILQRNPITLPANKVCTATVYVRTGKGRATANLRIASPYRTLVPVGLRPTIEVVDSTTASPGWSRLSVTFTSLDYPISQYYPQLEVQGLADEVTHVFFDALQIEEGTRSAYAPMDDFEFTVTASERSHLFYTTEPSSRLFINAYNNSSTPLSRLIKYQAYDWENKPRWSGEVTLRVEAKSPGAAAVPVPRDRLGHFRGVFASSEYPVASEIQLAVMTPAPSLTTKDTASYFGSHLNPDTNVIAHAKRLGVNWHRALELGMRWSATEPEPERYAFYDYSMYDRFNMAVLGQVGEDSPKWITDKRNILKHVTRYAEKLVTHYDLDAWEIWNEPDQDDEFGPDVHSRLEYYGQVVDLVAPVIRARAPKASIYAGGGVLSPAHLLTLLSKVSPSTLNIIDGFSVHEYGPNESQAESLKTRIADRFEKPILNTETGSGDKYGMTFDMAPFRQAGSYAIPWKSADKYYDSYRGNIEAITRNAIQCAAYGQKQWFYYDGKDRNIEVSDEEQRVFSWLNPDRTFKAKAIALGSLWRLMDKCIGHGLISKHPNFTAFAFTVSSNPMVAFWAERDLTVALTGLTKSDLKLFDIMGNTIPMEDLALHVSTVPQLMQGRGDLGLETLTNAFAKAIIINRRDTEPPALVITSFPRVVHPGVPAHFRWLALDASAAPNARNPNAILYRYSINGSKYSPWSGDTYITLPSLTTPPTLVVQARDAAGNIATARSSENVKEPNES